MKVTVCQLPNEPAPLETAWAELCTHVDTHTREDDSTPHLLLLPEMIFAPWPAWTREVNPDTWEGAASRHDAWLARLPELGASLVAGTRASLHGSTPFNEGYLWTPTDGLRPAHLKTYLPNDEGFWEATWYRRGPISFEPVEAGPASLGFMICTELWFTEHARKYARAGVHLIANPRATEFFSVDKWIAGGRAAAIMSGAYCLSSNHSGTDPHGIHWGGAGWVIDPDGRVLGGCQ